MVHKGVLGKFRCFIGAEISCLEGGEGGAVLEPKCIPLRQLEGDISVSSTLRIFHKKGKLDAVKRLLFPVCFFVSFSHSSS
jgi:hypothetical protein